MKTITQYISVVLFSTFILPVNAENIKNPPTLIVPETINLITLNGEKINSGFGILRSGNVSIDLKTGINEIALYYEELFDIDSDDHELLKSEPLVVTISAHSNKEYRLTHASTKKLENAKKLVKDFQISILDETDKDIIQTEYLIANSPVGNVKTTRKSNSDYVHIPNIKNNTNNKNPQVLQMLEYWWSQATEYERNEFLKSKK